MLKSSNWMPCQWKRRMLVVLWVLQVEPDKYIAKDASVPLAGVAKERQPTAEDIETKWRHDERTRTRVELATQVGWWMMLRPWFGWSTSVARRQARGIWEQLTPSRTTTTSSNMWQRNPNFQRSLGNTQDECVIQSHCSRELWSIEMPVVEHISNLWKLQTLQEEFQLQWRARRCHISYDIWRFCLITSEPEIPESWTTSYLSNKKPLPVATEFQPQSDA